MSCKSTENPKEVALAFAKKACKYQIMILPQAEAERCVKCFKENGYFLTHNPLISGDKPNEIIHADDVMLLEIKEWHKARK